MLSAKEIGRECIKAGVNVWAYAASNARQLPAAPQQRLLDASPNALNSRQIEQRRPDYQPFYERRPQNKYPPRPQPAYFGDEEDDKENEPYVSEPNYPEAQPDPDLR